MTRIVCNRGAARIEMGVPSPEIGAQLARIMREKGYTVTVDGPGVCVVCGGPAPSSSRCTNGCCGMCHASHCTPGGLTSPGHALRR